MGDLDDTSAAAFDFLLARLALENGTGSGHVLASKGLLQRRLDRAYSFRPEGMALEVAKARFIASRVQVVGLIWECLGRLGIPCDAPHAPRVLVMDVVHPRGTSVGGPIVVAKADGGARHCVDFRGVDVEAPLIFTVTLFLAAHEDRDRAQVGGLPAAYDTIVVPRTDRGRRDQDYIRIDSRGWPLNRLAPPQ